MTEETKTIPITSSISSLKLRPTSEFKALPERGRPGGDQGSSQDIQYFCEISTDSIWIGKCCYQAMTRSHARLPYYAQYHEEYSEYLGLLLYRLMGILVPQAALSMQAPLRGTGTDEHKLSGDLNFKDPCLHLMTQFVTGFQPCGKDFIEQYRKTATGQSHPFMVRLNDKHLPVRGFGSALAAACFLYDVDCLGAGGANMGYTLQTNEEGMPYARIEKIDAGKAFYFLEDLDDPTYAHDPRRRNFFYAPGRIDRQHYYLISYADLSVPDQREFAHTARRILQIPRTTIAAYVDQTVTRGGLTREKAKRLVDTLVARKSLFLAAYASEVEDTLKQEVAIAKKALLSQMLAHQPPSSVPMTDDMKWCEPQRTKSLEARDHKYWEEKESTPMKPMVTTSSVPALETSYSSSSFALTTTTTSSTPTTASTTISTSFPSASFSKSTPVSTEFGQLLSRYESQEQTTGSATLALQLELEREKKVSGLAGDTKTTHTRCITFQLPKNAKHFVERPELLMTVAEHLHMEQNSVVVQSLRGMGGVGKTQLATRYAQLAAQGQMCGEWHLNYQAVIWLYAEQDLGIQFQNMAGLLCKQEGLSVPKAIQSVYRYLQDKTTLLVFDNAVDETSIRPFLPPPPKTGFMGLFQSLPRGLHLLITSRNPYWPSSIPSLSIQEFSEAEASRYICQRLPDANTLEITRLLETVSCLPLALSQALAYIAAGHCTLAEYPEQFALHQLSLGVTIADSEEDSYAVLSTFLLSIARVEREHPGAMNILNVAAYLSPERIPRMLLIESNHSKPEEKTLLKNTSAMESALIRHALIQAQEDGSIDIHRLVQQVIRRRLTEYEQQQTIQKVLCLLATFYPVEGVGHLADVDREIFIHHMEAAIAHQRRVKLSADEAVAVILARLGNFYGERGNIITQHDLLTEALVVREKYCAYNHLALATLLTCLGVTHGKLGNIIKARDLLERALSIQEEPHEIGLVLRILVNLSTIYGQLGDLIKRRDLLEEVLAIQKMYCGLDHWEVAGVLTNLGTVYGALGETVKQRDLLERALAIKEKYYGYDHWEIVSTLVNLSDAYGELGNITKQCELLEQALAIDEKHYGRDHWQVANTLDFLGSAYGKRDIAKKCSFLERALAIKEKHYGHNHLEVALTLNNLGIAYGDLGETTKECDLLVRALAIKEKHYERDHPDVAITLSNLGNAYRILGDVIKACGLLERALMILEAHYEHNHPCVKVTRTHLDAAYSALEDTTRKQDLLIQELIIQEKPYGHNRWQVVTSHLNNSCDTLKDITKQCDLLAQALVILEQHYGCDHPALAVVLTNLAIAYHRLKQPHAAKAAAQRMCQIMFYHPQYGKQYPDTQRLLKSLQSACGFTIEDLALSVEEKKLELRVAQPPTVSPSSTLSFLTTASVPSKAAESPSLSVTTQPSSGPTVKKDIKQFEPSSGLIEAKARAAQGVVHYKKAEYVQAISFFIQVVAYARLQRKADKFLLSALYNLGTSEFRCQKWESALEHLTEARQLAEAISKQHDEAPDPKYQARLAECQMAHDKEKVAKSAPSFSPMPTTESMSVYSNSRSDSSSSAAQAQQSDTSLLDIKSSTTTLPSQTRVSLAQASSQQGLAQEGVRQAQQQLGQAVLALLTAINQQRQRNWEPQAHVSFTATVVSAFAKGKEAFAKLCAQPEFNSIPAALGQFVQDYVSKHPELEELSAYPDFVHGIKRDLINGKLDELYTRFGVTKPEQKTTDPDAQTSSCLVM